MKKKTYVIKDTDGHYYRSFCENYFTTAHSKVLVTLTKELNKARKFRSLRWATYRAKFLSIKASDYYDVYEITEQGLILRNEQVIEMIRKDDREMMEEVDSIIAEWKASRGLS